MDEECFPTLWSMGIIIPIFKSGEYDDPNNYRGICINSCLSKLFTMLLNDRLVIFCDINNLIHYNQIGFRRGFRTADHIFTLKTLVDKALYQKKKLYVCFVDFRKAYDTVWRDALFYKLLLNNISKKFVNILRKMYDKLQICVRLQNGLTYPFRSKVGLKQGCNLSPILFNIFINDFVQGLSELQTDAPSLENLKIGCLLYADDLVLISESEKGLQTSLDYLEKFNNKWDLKVNPSKTKYMAISKGKRHSIPQFVLGSIKLQNCESYCYLGNIITSNGSLKKTPQMLNDKATKALFSLMGSVNKFSACGVDILLELYDKMISPISLYGCEVWGVDLLPSNVKNTNILDTYIKSPVEKLHLKMMKRVLGVGPKATNWAVYTETGRYPLLKKILTMTVKYFEHICDTKSPILHAALNTNRNIFLENNHKSWYCGLKRMSTFCNMEDVDNISQLLSQKNAKIRAKFNTLWELQKQDHSSGKLDLYISLNPSFCLQPYIVEISNFKLRRSITKMRISDHKFPIETGRYDKKERNQRICPLCCEEVGDEMHYMLSCQDADIKNAREGIISKFSDPGFESLCKREKCKYILSLHDHRLLNETGTLCMKIQDTFRDVAM